MRQWGICAFFFLRLGVSVVSSQRKGKHYYITSLFNPPMSLPLFLFISPSVCYPPSTPHHTSSILRIPLVAAKALSEKLQGRQRKKRRRKREERKSETVIYKSRIIKKKKSGTRIHCFRSLPCFLFSLSLLSSSSSQPPPPSPLLPPSALLFSLRRSRQIKIQLTDV